MAPPITPVAPDARTRAARQGLHRGETRTALLYLVPAGVVLVGLLAYPLYQLVVISLFDYGQPQAAGAAPLVFTGFENYVTLLGDPRFWDVLAATVVFAAVCVGGSLLVGTALAVLASRASPWARKLLFLAALGAWATPAMAGSYVWLFLFDQDFGLVNEVLTTLGLPVEGRSWTFERFSAFGLVAAEIVWCSFPFVMVTMYAGISAIPKEVVEAAALDGASATRTATSVLLPILRPLIAIATVQSTIWDFKVFTQIYLMPGGNGGNKEVFNLGVWSYIQSFAQGKYGMGSAIAVLLTLILLGITVVYMRTLFKEEEL